MQFPLSWLKELIDLPHSAEEIAAILTNLGIEVDAVLPRELPFTKVVVAEVKETEPHPDAEKLCVAQVFDGADTYQVVCGASNCRPGLKTAFAPKGATLLEENGKVWKIKKGKLRGVESHGMLCAADELGLPGDSSGIMELGENYEVGIPLENYFQDSIFEISLTPNLAYCSNLRALARELSAATKTPCKFPETEVKEEGAEIGSKVQVEVSAIEECPRYTCRVIEGVKVAPSPEWLQERLESCGIRSLNNVVDCTNYVLLEMGQPLHAFDLDEVKGKKVHVRTAETGENFTTLDGLERKLESNNLLICDGERPIALGGVMGGENSEVSDKTVSILLESAYFKPSNVRKTSKTFSLQTDASWRYERGCDPNACLPALDRAAQLIADICGGQIAKGTLDVSQGPFSGKTIRFRLARSNALLGLDLPLNACEDIFERLGFSFERVNDVELTVSVPSYRVDLGIEEDLIEEVARLHGYQNIPRDNPRFQASTIQDAPIYIFETEVRSNLLREGLQEFLTCDLISPKQLEGISKADMTAENVVRVLNPSSVEQSILRPTLLPGLLQILQRNQAHQISNIAGFEVGRIHFKDEDGYHEHSMAGIVLCGEGKPKHWTHTEREVDFYDLKGVVENLVGSVSSSKFQVRKSQHTSLHPGRQADILVDNLDVGVVGEIHPSLLRFWDIQGRVFFAEINLHDLAQGKAPKQQMSPICSFPPSDRDWTITLDEEVPAQEVLEAILANKSRLLESVSIKDIYRSESLGADKKNLTLNFVYRDDKKTVSFETVESEHKRITERTIQNLGICV